MYFKLGKKKIGGDEREGPTYSSFLNFIGQRQKKLRRPSDSWFGIFLILTIFGAQGSKLNLCWCLQESKHSSQ